MAEEIEQPFLLGTASALGQLPDQVWEEVRRAINLGKQTEAFWDHLLAFLHAVDWTVRAGLAAAAAAAVSYVCSLLSHGWLHTHAGDLDQRHPGGACGHLPAGAAVPAKHRRAHRRVHVARWVCSCHSQPDSSSLAALACREVH